MFERHLAAEPSLGRRDGALVGLTVSFGVHALAFAALLAGAWIAVGSIHAPSRRSHPLLPPFSFDPPPAAAAPLPRSTSASRPEKERTRQVEPPTEMVQPEIVPEVVPDPDLVDAGDDEEFWEEGIPDGSRWGIPGGHLDGIPGGVPDGDPNGVIGGDRGGTGTGPVVPDEIDEPIVLSGKILRPVKVHDVRPDYPEHARKARLEGNVSLELVVDREGRVENVQVLSGNEIFRRAAVEAVSRWRYRPALQNGTPVKVVMSVLVEFRLR